MVFTESGLINSELDCPNSGTSSEVVLQGGYRNKCADIMFKKGARTHHSSLQSALPSIEVHAGELSHRRTRQMDVERLTLVDESSSVGGEIDDGLLRDLPNSLVDSFELSRNSRNCG